MSNIEIEQNGERLFTSFYPNYQQETVILLHGGPGIPSDLKEVADLLKQDYQVICFHQRGTGLSPCNGDYSIARYLADIDVVARHFAVDKFHLFGYSWGGLYAQLYALKYPAKIQSIFLCSPSAGVGAQWKEMELELLKYNYQRSGALAFINMGLNALLGLLGSDKSMQKSSKQIVRNYNKGFEEDAQLYSELVNIKAAPINSTRSALLSYPALPSPIMTDYKITISFGDQDIYGASKRYTIHRYPQAIVQTIEKSGHFPWHHHKERFEQVLRGHFDGII